MIKANALYIVIVIALVISIFSGMLILSSYYKRVIVAQNISSIEIERNLESAIEYVLALNEPTPQSEDSIALDLFNEGNDSIYIIRKSWGVFELAKITATRRGNSVIKSFLYGVTVQDSLSQALYLVDEGVPLQVSGYVSIKGNCYLPSSGISQAYIPGYDSQNPHPIKGHINKSSSELPSINEKSIEYLINLSANTFNTQIYPADFESEDTLVVSFNNPTNLIHSIQDIVLNKALIGNIILLSDKSVRISSLSTLQDVIVIAPKIYIEPNFSGNAQFIATDSIVVYEKANLKYPSALVIVKEETETYQPSIVVQPNVIFSGSIITYQKQQSNLRPLILIKDNAVVTGEIYSDGYIQLEGKLLGNIITRKFLLRTPSSVYENHIADCIIDRTMLPLQYTGSVMIPHGNDSTIMSIIKWLH